MDALTMRDDSLSLLHLPFDQRAEVHVRAGISARDAISTVLKQRNIVPEMSTVSVDSDPQSPQIDLQMDMQLLARQLDRKELWVHSACMELFESVRHEFIYRPFPSTTNCGACQKMILVQGYRCKRYLFVFHKSCWDRVPTFCAAAQIPYDLAKANQLRDVCAKNSGRLAPTATDILDSLVPAGSPPQQGPVGIEGQAAMRFRETPATPKPAPYARQGSSSMLNAFPSMLHKEGLRSASEVYSCQHCAITFQDRALYLIHCGYHSYDNPYKCNRCGHVSQDSLQFNLHQYQDSHDVL